MNNLALYRDGLDQTRKERESVNRAIGSIEFESEEERSRYLVGVFPGLVKEGNFVQAMELVHENSSFNWLYGLVDKVQQWLFRKEKDAVAASKATIALKESPRSGKENIVWFPPDFGRTHQPGNHKNPMAA
jgi:hypothetical protein